MVNLTGIGEKVGIGLRELFAPTYPSLALIIHSSMSQDGSRGTCATLDCADLILKNLLTP